MAFDIEDFHEVGEFFNSIEGGQFYVLTSSEDTLNEMEAVPYWAPLGSYFNDGDSILFIGADEADLHRLTSTDGGKAFNIGGKAATNTITLDIDTAEQEVELFPSNNYILNVTETTDKVDIVVTGNPDQSFWIYVESITSGKTLTINAKDGSTSTFDTLTLMNPGGNGAVTLRYTAAVGWVPISRAFFVAASTA